MRVVERREREFIFYTKLELSATQLMCFLIFRIFAYHLIELLIHRGMSRTRIVPMLKPEQPINQNL